MSDVVYRIIIEGMDGGAGSGTPRSTAATTKGEDINPIAKLYKQANKIMHLAPVAYALKLVNTMATVGINRVELRTGRSTYQQQLQWTKQAVMKGVSIGGMILGGAITGNPMAIVAGVGSLAMTALNYGIEQQNLNLERRVENISIGMANIRAGAGGRG